VTLDAFAERYGFDQWSEPERGAEALFIWRFALGGGELPGHRAVRIETVGHPDAPAIASLWSAEEKDGLLVRVDVNEAPSVPAARAELLRVLGEFQSPKIERVDGPGDVAFGPSGSRALAFTRANVVVLMRNAGVEVEPVERPARELDELLREGPGPDRGSVRPVIGRAAAEVRGSDARLVLDAEDPLGRRLWFRFAAKSGEFRAEPDGVVFTPEGEGTHVVEIAAINENLGEARERVEFTI
jgi:hypothetical protein